MPEVAIDSICRRDDLRMYNKTQAGFTLLEMIAVIVIAAIMVTMAIPSLATFIKNNRMTTQINDFVATANIARMEAIKRGQRVVVCKSTDTNTCIATGRWDQGWIAFVDANTDGTHDAAEDIISSHDALVSGSTFTGYDEVANTFYFNANGSSNLTGYGEMVLCDDRKNTSISKAITLNPVGRVETINASEAAATHQCS